MRIEDTSLQQKVILGYMILIVVICSIVAILLHERSYMKEIKTETSEIRRIRHDVSAAHRGITELATRGESVMAWENADYCEYRKRRLNIDSLLQALKVNCGTFVRPEHIDTLRSLLEDKEKHLLQIMETFDRQEKADSLLVTRLPEVVRQATHIRTVKQRKEGLAGFLGGKKTRQLLPSAQKLHTFSGNLIAMQKERTEAMAAYTDSLRNRNRELNGKLYSFITYLDGKAEVSFKQREEKVTEAWELSYRLFSVVIVFASILLVVSFLIIRHDIRKEESVKSQLRKIIRENKDLLEMRKQIILTVSHDIRGPLGNINNCAELASDTREKKKREGYLESIRHSCQHILRLVNNLMDVYKINETRDIRNDVPFRLEKLLGSVSEEYARKANDKALLFKREHKNCSVTVKGDADKLEQILDNLLTNAVKFTPSGTIGFCTEYTTGKLFVEICDTGIGMDRETVERVFRPFERAAQEVNSEGFGLGLFITKALVKVLDGTIDVKSQPGKGTMFHLMFPLPETTEKVEAEEVPSQIPAVLPKRVLVVDDDTILLKIAEDMLGRNGVICTTCHNAKEAVLALRNSDYDLVLTDIQMPVTDGFGLLKLFRSSDIGNSRTVPVAVMTARGDGDSGVYVKSGFCGYIHKPFSMKGLLAFISSVTTGHISGKSFFDYERLMENTDDRRHMFDLIAEESEKDLAELECALEGHDRAMMRKAVHRMMPVWELLGADGQLSDYRCALHDKAVSDEILKEHTLKIMEQIRTLIDEANNEKRKINDEKDNIDCRG